MVLVMWMMPEKRLEAVKSARLTAFIQQIVCEYWPREEYCDSLVDILSLWPVMTILSDPDGQVEARRKNGVVCVLVGGITLAATPLWLTAFRQGKGNACSLWKALPWLVRLQGKVLLGAWTRQSLSLGIQ